MYGTVILMDNLVHNSQTQPSSPDSPNVFTAIESFTQISYFILWDTDAFIFNLKYNIGFIFSYGNFAMKFLENSFSNS